MEEEGEEEVRGGEEVKSLNEKATLFVVWSYVT